MENLLYKGLTLSEAKANELHQKLVGRIAGERLLWRYGPCVAWWKLQAIPPQLCRISSQTVDCHRAHLHSSLLHAYRVQII